MKSIAFIYFDVGGVLIDWQNVFSTAAEIYHLSIDEIGSVFDENSDDLTKGFMSPSQLWLEVIKKFNIQNANKFDFLSSWVADYKPISPTHELIKGIKRNYNIGLLSNIYKGMLPLLLDKELIPIIAYQSIVFFCNVGLMKPELEIYAFAQEKSGVSAHEILFVDDKQENLNAAESLGWQTFLFDSLNIESAIRSLQILLKDNFPNLKI